MLRALKSVRMHRKWWLAGAAGLLGLLLALTVMEVVDAYAVSVTALSIALSAIVGSQLGILIAHAVSGHRVKLKMREQYLLLSGALNNMNQGLCMFDPDNRLVVWNERYVNMYRIEPRRIWYGCTIRDLLDARIAAGTFPLEPGRYDNDLRAALKQGKAFTLTIELHDGRTIAVVNQPMASGGWVATHEDITERKRAERELENTRKFLDMVIEHVPSPIVVKELPSLRYRLVNRAAETFLGVKREQILNKTAAEAMPKVSADAISRLDEKLLESGEAVISEAHAFVTPNNGTRVVSGARLPVLGPDGKPQYMLGVFRDLTERRRHEQRIAHLSRHDLLTDLPNRAAFDECIAATIDLAANANESFGLLCIDLDRFQEVNDVYGHPVGDALLREIAIRLGEACQGAFIARLNGDEFSVITPTGPQPETAEAMADRLRAALDCDIAVGDHSLRASLTIGIAVYPHDGADAAALIANSSAALHRAKSEGLGSVCFFEISTDKELREKRALQQDLRTAIARNEMVLHYQPQALIDGTITGFEALVRWHHPRYGMVPPSTFIPLAEENGSIITIGEWVLRAACQEAAAWPAPLQVAVNLSPAQFVRGDLPGLVHQVLLETGLRPQRLELEITEGVLIGDFNRAVSVLRRLKALGVRIAMDDFGTGYSSLSYLQSFPFDKIKIDQTFIANLRHSRQSATIIRAVIALGRGLDLPVVAEGVETKEQLEFLAQESCTGMQGYLIGRPQPIEAYADMVGRAPVALLRPSAAAG